MIAASTFVIVSVLDMCDEYEILWRNKSLYTGSRVVGVASAPDVVI